MPDSMPGAGSTTAVRPSASVILCRRGPRGLEVFWVRRGEQLRFAGGFYAFPGGRVDESDGLVAVRGASGVEAALIAGAVRELFEETGVLAVAGAARVPPAERRMVREALVVRPASRGGTRSAASAGVVAQAPGVFAQAAGVVEQTAGGVAQAPGFAAFLSAHGLEIDAADFPFAGRWITPPAMPIRFDARFYLAELPAGEEAVVWPGELADGEWIRPADALLQWDSGRALLHPPAWHTLRSLAIPEAAAGDPRAALPFLQDPARAPWKLPIDAHVVQRMEFQRGVLIVPLRTPTLPPATHTNCLLLGDDRLLVVDPGSPWPEEQAVLEETLSALAAEGRKAEAILLTHYHVDHVAGAMALSEKLGLPILAHAETRARLEGEVRVDRLLDDAAPLEFGPRGWRALHLPGHTRGHLCMIEQGSGAVIAGDLVAGTGTVVIDPPEGDMADYLGSLARLIGLSPGTIYPAHGPVVPGGADRLRAYVTHRLEREALVAAALAAAPGPALPAALVPAAYPDVAPELYPLAERSLLAHLQKLVKDRRALVDESGHFRPA